MRLYPHLQDTGGFFVAVLQRKPRPKAQYVSLSCMLNSSTCLSRDKKRGAQDSQDLPESKKVKLDTPEATTSVQTEEGASEAPVAQTPEDLSVADNPESEADVRTFSETPYTFLPPNDPIVQNCMYVFRFSHHTLHNSTYRDRLHLSSSFPSANILVRNPAGEPARSLYIANDLVKSVITHNDYARIRLHTAGTKVFTKHDGGKAIEAQFRVVGEGVPVVIPFMDPGFLIPGDLANLRVFLESYFPLCTTFQEPFRGVMEARCEYGFFQVLFCL